MNAFVILHYRAYDSTNRCVSSIKALEGDNHIVIVDNASPDGTGLLLREKYAGDERVSVLLGSENAGFARGNNFGVRFAWEKLRPDFMVVLNDDVEIEQRDFALRLPEIYKNQPFDLLGPDIVSVFSGIHQNPKSLKHCSLDSTRKKLAYVRRSQNPILMLLSSGQKNSPAIWRRVQRKKRARQNIDSSVPARDVMLHGACVIFSKRYIERHPEPFFPGTFMYYEMEILDWLCRREGCVVLYDPSISLIHYQYVATKMEFRSIIKRSKFVASCLGDSLLAAEELMERLELPQAEEERERAAGPALMDA